MPVDRPVTEPRFATGLEKWGERPALLSEQGEAMTYAELATASDAFAARLGADVHLIAIEMRNVPEAIIAMLGVLRRGVPAILHSGVSAAQNILASCPPDASYALDEETGQWRLELTPQPWTKLPRPGLAIMLSTSGSTGSAKLVKLSGTNLQANAQSIAAYLELDKGERAITALPPAYSYGLSVLNSHFAVGASIVLTDESAATPAFREIVERNEVTSLAGVPYSYELMERSGLLADLPSSVRTLTQAGGRMAPEMVRSVARTLASQGARLIVMYGQTEASPRIAYLPPLQLESHADCIGRAIPGGELWVEGDKGERQPIGVEGELVYRGPNVMMGYASSRDDLTTAPGPDVLRTGDLAMEVDPGLFRITGRSSRFVKPFGLRISLDEIEARCRAEGAPAFVAGADDLIAVAAEIPDAAQAKRVVEALDLPPGLVVFLDLDTMPRLSGGKPDYQGILREARAVKSARADATGLGAVEILFGRLSRGEGVTPGMSFESLGGDSLSYVQCSMAIEAALGHIPDAWERLTLAELRALYKPTDRTKHGWRWMTLESDIILRSAAILLVLFQHALGGLQGGADVLMVLAGLSWARFQRPRLLRGDSKGALIDFARRYLAIYMAVLVAVSTFNRQFYPAHFLFISTFIGSWGGILNTYWFIESLTWCVVVTCAALAVPAMRRLFQTRPLASALGFVVVAVAVRLIVGHVLDVRHTALRSPDQLLLYFATGWALAFSGNVLRAALFALLMAASAAAWGWKDTHVAALLVAAVMIIGAPRLRLPSLIARAVTLVASASFYIYLFNPIPMYVTDQILHARNGRFWWEQILSSLVLGVAVYFGVERLNTRADGRWFLRKASRTAQGAQA